VGIGWQILWVACGVATIIAAALANRSGRARYLGRVAVGVLFIVGGALLHVINLATGGDYAGFADPAHFAWVTDAWHAVVAPNQVVFLAVGGGRKTQVGYMGVIAFYLALWLFGWFETVWCILMLPAMLLLLRAEQHAATAPVAGHDKPPADVGT
jgi:hypothetical protein